MVGFHLCRFVEISSSKMIAPKERMANEKMKRSATIKLELAESSGGDGHSWSKASGINSAAASAAVKSAGKSSASRIVKESATTKPELAESSDEAGPCCSRANDNSAAVTAAVKSAGETRSSRIVKYSVTSESESELAEDLELVRVALQQRRGMR